MLLGYNTNGFTSHALADALAVIAGIGYKSVGLTIDHHALNPMRADWPTEAARCRELLRTLGLTCVVETGARFLLDPWRKHQPTLLDEHPKGRQRREEFLEAVIEIACALEAPVISLWSGAAPEGTEREVLDWRLAGALERLAEHAAPRGILLALEPEPGMYVATMADFERIRKQVPHPSLRLTLDIGHAHLTEASALETIHRFRHDIVNVHLEGMQRPDHDHRVPWEGDLDVGAALRKLVEIGYDGPATFELSRHSHDAVQTARRAFSFAQKALAATP
jgi:sugar phosphate isomerase/epimerase